MNARLTLSTTRIRQSSTNRHPTPDELLLAFESDRGRVLNSAAVRRLQQKTQVFPLEKNSAVRSRLTHSLEVMQVGRFIVQSICGLANNQDKRPIHEDLINNERALESLVEMACVLHDVGNPPFGHFGEHAINMWFSEHLHELFEQQYSKPLNSHPLASHPFNNAELALLKDAEHFEGNAQAIRLVHSLMDLNLSYPLIGSILKYTRCGTQAKIKGSDPFFYLQKKVGYYASEQDIVGRVQKALLVKPLHRYTPAYIMEAADDISYCMADLEDAVEKEILSIEQLTDALKQEFTKLTVKFGIDAKSADSQKMQAICDKAMKAFEEESIRKESMFFVSFRVGIVHPLVEHASRRFIDNIDALANGSFNQALLEDKSAAHALSQSLKNVAYEHAFSHKEVETLELQGYEIITSLFNRFGCLLKLTGGEFKDICLGQGKHFPIESRLVKRIGKKYIATYLKSLEALHDEANHSLDALKMNDKGEKIHPNVSEYYLRCRLLQDHISGMTDQFALDEYQTLRAHK